MPTRLFCLLAALLLLSPDSAKACSCGPPPPDFLKDLRQTFEYYSWAGLDMNALVVVKGVATGKTSDNKGILFKPIQRYYGKTRDTFIIWGSDGSDCRLGVGGFYKTQVDTFIILLNRIRGKNYQFYDTSDFYINACGNRVLQIRNDSVFGGAPGTFAFNGFPLNLFEKDSLNFWIHALKVAPEKSISLGATLFPNPVAHDGILNLQGHFPEDLRIKITDLEGREIACYYERGNGSQERLIPLNISELVEGVYFLHASSASRAQTLRFTVINH